MSTAPVPPTHPPARLGLPEGAIPVDTTDNPRIPMLMEMVGAISRARDPHEVLYAFTSGVRRLHGAMGIASRLRHRGTNDQRHHQPAG